MKKIVIASLIVLAVVFVSGFIFLRSKSYPTLEIEADNYEQKLKTNNQDIYASEVNKCIPDAIDILHSIKYAPSDNFENNGLSISKEKKDNFNGVDISSSNSTLDYLVWFDKDNSPIMCSISSKTYDPKLKEICNQLMLNGFVLKKTRLLNGHDILIKETEQNFIIVNINQNYENPNPPMSLHIRTYGKEKSLF